MFLLCCFCVSLRTGSFLIGLYAVISSIITLGYLIYEAQYLRKEENEDEENVKQKRHVKQFLVILLVCQVLKIIAGLVILISVWKEFPRLLIAAAVTLFSVFVFQIIVELIRFAASGIGSQGLISAVLSFFLVLYFTSILWSYAQQLLEEEEEEEFDYYDDEWDDQDPYGYR